MAQLVNLFIFTIICVCIWSWKTVDGCPDGWTGYQESCYHFSHDTEPWELAQMVCRDMGAHLVEIESAAENNFVTNELQRRHATSWIGANDLLIENEWRWASSHNRITFANWAPREPTNSNGNENCADIRNFDWKWNDERCDSSQNYICEMSVEAAIVG
ncbi:perlucin-like protein isoform X2 [Dreissena polymorpha]|uniref:perlucin-like protein isoform X2 n=1 Tax=Dreissena polymorpha TaxID=45954 RepID=UPI002264E7D6|nr:perlucin-like protein isoform X2 [Dreissena polymorpha]